MKFVILFIGLTSLLIVNVNAYAHTGFIINNIPSNCNEFFKVNECDECQKEVHNSWTNPSSCGFTINLIKNILKNYAEAAKNSTPAPYNMGPYNKAVEQSCAAEFSCEYDEAKSSWERIEKSCSKQLENRVDWGQNPTTIDKTVADAHSTLLFYYFGIPDQKSNCLKNSRGELCGIEISKPYVDWLRKEIPDGNYVVTYDHRFVYKLSDGSRLEIPREFFSCNECPKMMVAQYKDWPYEHPLPYYIVENVFGSWEKLQDYYTCPNDSGKMKLKRTFDRRSRRSTEHSGFSHFVASTRYII